MREAPARIGPYEILERLGVGGMGETYVALRRGPGGFEQRVCLKRVRADVADDPELIRQFQAEARILAKLRHANIAQVLDFGEQDGAHYLTLELVEGLDLRELLRRSEPLDADAVLYLAVELATALDVAHRADDGAVIHRDVSTSNVLLSREGEVKLTDFGIARPLDGPAHTRSGIVKGKVPYLAPEYARTGEVDPRVDLFSLGVTLYECAAGARPYDGATDLDTLERAARGQRIPLADIAPELPAQLREQIERLIKPDPAQRFQSARELLEALDELPPPPPRARRDLGSRVQKVSRPRGRRPTPAELAPTVARRSSATPDTATRTRPSPPAEVRPPMRRTGPLVALTLALLAALGIGVFALNRGDDGDAHQVTPAPPPNPSDHRPAEAPGTKPAPPTAAAPVVVLPEGASAEAAALAAPEADAPDEPGREPTPTEAADAETGAATPRKARLEVVVIPYGEVSVDGRERGSSPVKIRVSPGSHRITARNADRTFERRVTLEAGERKRVVLR